MPKTMRRRRRHRRVGGDGEGNEESAVAGNMPINENSYEQQPSTNNLYGSEEQEYQQPQQPTQNNMYDSDELKSQPQPQPQRQPTDNTSTTQSQSSTSFLGRISNSFKTAKIKLYNWMKGIPNQPQTGGRRRRHSRRTRHKKTHRKIKIETNNHLLWISK